MKFAIILLVFLLGILTMLGTNVSSYYCASFAFSVPFDLLIVCGFVVALFGIALLVDWGLS